LAKVLGIEMNFFDLKNISERYMELVNPTTPEKIVRVGKLLGLKPGARVIDFGCGFGEGLALWAEQYGIGGVGIDIREHACERARQKMIERGFADRIEIVCMDAAQYRFAEHTFDAAACIGATFIWSDYRSALRALSRAIRPGGKLAVGEAYWRTSRVPPEFAQREKFETEAALIRNVRTEGFELEYIVRASENDWDRYESDNWYGLIRWLEANPNHPERAEVINHLHASQDEYFRYGREYLGWAIQVLSRPDGFPETHQV
jgi:ubiquinone/menaquinone biosynthesis C-methylase UbiE